MGVKVSYNFEKVMSVGEIKYFENGELVTGREASAVLVDSEDELEALSGLVSPGSIAFTAGFGSAWQMKPDGTWAALTGGETLEENPLPGD